MNYNFRIESQEQVERFVNVLFEHLYNNNQIVSHIVNNPLTGMIDGVFMQAILCFQVNQSYDGLFELDRDDDLNWVLNYLTLIYLFVENGEDFILWDSFFISGFQVKQLLDFINAPEVLEEILNRYEFSRGLRLTLSQFVVDNNPNLATCSK